MRYQRIIIEVDAIKMPTKGSIGGNTFDAGDYLVTYEDGSVAVLPPDVFESNFQNANLSTIKPVVENQDNSTTNITPAPPRNDAPPKASPDMFTCLGCSQDVPAEMFDKAQGVCFDCLKVKCPTCGAVVKRSEMRGQYCPNCLRSPR